MKNIATIKILGIETYGKHGVKEIEHLKSQKFIVDISYKVDISNAMQSDSINDTVSYSTIQKKVIQIIEGEHCDLIETLVKKLSCAILSLDERIISVKITLHKPQAPLSNPFSDVIIKLKSDQN